MPELPEVQALAERLDEALAGRPLRAVTPFAFAALKTVRPAYDEVVGKALERVSRRGKYLVFDFGSARVLVHLSQGGRIDLEQPPKKTKPRGAVVRFAFDDVAVLVKEFGTERKAGWWVLEPSDDGPLAVLGPEPAADAFAEFVLNGDDTRRVHTILRDQRTVAGIGRGYSDEILHRAQISPYASHASLGEAQRRALLDATRAVLDEALAAERTRSGGLPAQLKDRFAVHGRAGLPCPRCGGELRRVSYESHEVAYCPACQTGGKVLADRRMSRLIR